MSSVVPKPIPGPGARRTPDDLATIVLPLTLVTGVYGMNFRVMPELQWTDGYPAVLLGMETLAAALVLYFERRNYI